MIDRVFQLLEIPFKDVISVQVNIGVPADNISHIRNRAPLDKSAALLMLATVIAFVTKKRIENKKSFKVAVFRCEPEDADFIRDNGRSG